MIEKDTTKSRVIIEKTKNMPPQKRKTSGNKKIKALLDCIKILREEGFTGYIKVNFSQGSIARVEKFEEILKH